MANGRKLRLTRVKTPLLVSHHVNLGHRHDQESHRVQTSAPVGIMGESAILHDAPTNSVDNLGSNEGDTNSVGRARIPLDLPINQPHEPSHELVDPDLLSLRD